MALIDKIISVGKKAGLVAAMGIAALSLSGKADAGLIEIYNYTDTSGIGKTSWNAKNIDGATEGYGYGDISFINPTQTNALLINSNVDGHTLRTDARPTDTYGFNFDLSIKGSINNIDNYLKYRVTDSTDLTNPAIIIGGAEYPLIIDNAIHGIILPNVTGTNTTYASGYLQFREQPATSPVAEPTGLVAAALGLLVLSKKRM